MPELDFKGKEFVRNHHLTVPYRPLVPDAAKSVGEPNLNGNLIIHGDNLVALKALLPVYAGKVDCIFIDPPYNTGNEGWRYNDNVNSPQLKAWFSENPVGIEDGLRHDKWCCMMWPRLKLLWELLAETGSIWITLDDNEVHRLRSMMDEVFGSAQFLANIVWQKKYAVSNDASGIASMHDHLIGYSKTSLFARNLLERRASANEKYSNDDQDGRGPWRPDNLLVRTFSEDSVFPIKNPANGVEHMPPQGSSWRGKPATIEKWLAEGRIFFGQSGKGAPQLKRYLNEVIQGSVPGTWWTHQEVGHNDAANKELTEIMGFVKSFDTPKPVKLISRILQIATSSSALVLDCFAGSGTTAHAVLGLNKKDGGLRKFILVEILPDDADKVTAERVRRVINGYPYQGTQRETLFERKLTWTELKKGEQLRAEAENTKTMYADQYDAVKITVDDGVLKVIGERNVEETAPGLGGSFTYCTLGEPLEVLDMLRGEGLPAKEPLCDWLLYVASGKRDRDPVTGIPPELEEFFVARQGDTYYWLLYRPDRAWLQSPDAALTLDRARLLAKVAPNGLHRVFGPVKYASNKLLRSEGLNIEFATIPFALLRRGGE